MLLQQVVADHVVEHRPANTALAYDPKINEYEQYCDSIFVDFDRQRRYTISPGSIYSFMFYHSYREKRKGGKGRDTTFDRADYEVVTNSTLKSKETREIDGVDHYVVRVDISSAAHPYFTGQERFLDAAGWIEKFRKKFGDRYTKKS